MSTIRASNQRDPPQTTTNVVGFKRLRKTIIAPVSGNIAITVGDIASCLPFQTNNSEFRILKFSVWGPDSAGSTSSIFSPISCVFPVSNPATAGFNGTPGDNAVWADEGTAGHQRAQIHLTPAFDYRNYWLGPLNNGPGAIVSTISTSTTSTVIVDVSVQYRTVVQACPAMEYLNELRREDVGFDVCDDMNIHNEGTVRLEC